MRGVEQVVALRVPNVQMDAVRARVLAKSRSLNDFGVGYWQRG